MDKHQTVEVTCRPSMKSIMVDIWYQGVHQEPAYICMDAQQFYSVKFYPNCLLKLGCTSAPAKNSDFAF